MLSERSRNRMRGVHPDLVRVISRASELSRLWGIEFVVTEGVRSLELQQKLLEAKATKTLRSRHLTGHAVDLAVVVDGKIRWDWPLYHRLSEVVKCAASQTKVPIEWGGDWETFKDGPHFQLPWKSYAA